jgi:hypothetical protein
MSRTQAVEDATTAVRDLASTVAEQTPQLADRALTVLGEKGHDARIQLDRQLDALAASARTFADDHAEDVPRLIERAQRATERLDEAVPALRETIAPAAATGVVAAVRRKRVLIGVAVVGSIALVGFTLARRARRSRIADEVGDVPEVPPLVPPVDAPIDPVDHHDPVDRSDEPRHLRTHGAA